MNKQLNKFFIFSSPFIRLWVSLFFFILIHFQLTSQTGPKVINLADVESEKYKGLDTNGKIKYIDSLYTISANITRRNADSALIVGYKIKDLSQLLDYTEGIARAQETIARANVNKGNYEDGIALAKETLNYALEIGADEVYLDCINVLGLAHFLKQELHNVYRYNQMGLKYSKKIGSKQKMYLFSNNAGTILARIGDYDKALEYYNSCLSMLEQNPDSVSLAQVLNNLGSMLYHKGDYSTSEKRLEESIKISSVLKMTSWESDAHITLAKIALLEKDFTEAEKQLNLSYTLLTNSKDAKQRIETDLGFAKLEFHNNELQKAESTAFNALQKAKESSYYRGIIDASELLHKISAKQNKNKEAYEYLLNYNRLTDSLNLANNENQVKVMVVEKNLTDEQEIVELKLNQKLAKQNIYIGIAIFSILVLGTILFLIKRISETRKKLITQLNVKTLELEKNKTELIALNNTKDKLFSIIGHDLKGPMGSLQSLLNLLVSGDLKTDEFMNFIPKVTSDVEHLNFTLNNLLFWASTQLRGLSINPSNTDLHELVTINYKLFQPKSIEKAITLKNEIPEGTLIWADSNQMDIVLRNLINNALKFTKTNGSITVKCNEEKSFKIVSVIDTGVGISQDVLDTLFKSSTAVTTYGTKNEKGTGLGLSICKEMVENNGGKIWVKSIINEGTTFQFSVPSTQPIENVSNSV